MKFAFIVFLLTTLFSTAQALVIHGTPVLSVAEEQVSNLVGKVGAGSGIYLGQGLVMTAGHVSPGDLELDGVTLPHIPHTSLLLEDTAGTPVDLLLFRVETAQAPNHQLRINADPLGAGASVLMVGSGLGQKGSPLTGFDGSAFGYMWSGETHHQAGHAQINHAARDRITLGFMHTPIFTTSFDEVGPSAQATRGDSGGAAFMVDPTTGVIELVGVIVGTDGPEGHSRFGTNTQIADLSAIPYFQQIEGLGDSKLTRVPEPSSAFLVAVALSAQLIRRKKRQL